MNTIPIIRGFNRTSEAGNDVFAISIFLGGCNLRCPYCMNHSLALNVYEKEIDLNEIKKYVVENKCKQVNISGGEPTCSNIDHLIHLIEEVKSWGCLVGISTNGTKIGNLRIIIPIVDYVTLDIKTDKSEIYDKITLNSENKYTKSLVNVITAKSILTENKLIRKDFGYELRTTLYRPFIDEKSIEEIGSIILKEEKWVLQQFRNNMVLLDESAKNVEPYNEKEVNNFLKIAKKYCNNVSLRYV